VTEIEPHEPSNLPADRATEIKGRIEAAGGRIARKEGSTPDSRAQLDAVNDTVVTLLPGLMSYRSSTEQVDVNRPQQSLAKYAEAYAKAREALDAAIAAQDEAKIAELGARAVFAGDELAVRAALNPTSRIRPAFDRRGMREGGGVNRGLDPDSQPARSQVTVPVGQSTFRAGIPWTEVKDSPAEKLYVRIFNAKMDFLSWRIEHDLIAVDDTDVSVDLVLTARTGPVELTGPGRDIKLPDGVDRVHFYVQPERRHLAAAEYARRGYHTEHRPELDT